MGRVYRVRHRNWNRELAVKCPKLGNSERLRAAFEHEAQLWVELDLHPNVCACHYVRRLDGVPHVFAEFTAGGSLERWVRDRTLYAGGREDALARMLDAAIGAARGLVHAHERGIVHRDIKPANVLLDLDGEAKVADFGIARATAPGAASRPYRSPEQATATSAAAITASTDVWSLAVSVLELFLGGPPMDGLDAPQMLAHIRARGDQGPGIPAIPAALDELLERCLREEPAARPAMAEVARELEAVYEHATEGPYGRPLVSDAALAAGELSNRALSMLDLGHPEEAERAWAQALAHDPLHAQATFNRGLYLWRAGRARDDELVRKLEIVRRAHGSGRVDEELLALVHGERGDREAAATDAPDLVRCVAGDRGSGRAESAALTPNGHLGVVAAGGTVHVWDVTGERHAGTLGVPGDAAAVAIAATSRVLAGTAEGVAYVCDRAATRPLEGHTALVHTVALTADGTIAVTGCRDGTARIWDVGTGACRHVLDAHQDSVTGVALSASGHVAVTAGFDGWLRIWDPRDGRCVSTIDAHGDWIWALALTPDGQLALTGGHDGSARLWDLRRAHRICELDGGSGHVHAVGISQDGRRALTGDERGRVRVWRTDNGRCLRTLSAHDESVEAIALSADGRCALTGDGRGTMRLWRVSAEERRCTFAYTPPRPPRDVALAEARRRDALREVDELLAADRAQAAVERLRALRGAPGSERHPDVIERWRVAARRARRGVLLGAWPELDVRAHDVEPRKRRSITRWGAMKEMRYLPVVSSAPGPQSHIRAIAVTPDGRLAVTASHDHNARCWELATGDAPCTLRHDEWATAAAIAADGRLVVTGSQDGGLWLWEPASLGSPRRIDAHDDTLASIALTPDGRLAVSGSFDGTARIWDLEREACLRTLDGQRDPVALSSDGRLALTAARDHTVRLWEVASGRCLRSLPAGDHVSALGATPDGRVAVTTCRDELQVWDLCMGNCVRRLKHPGYLSAAAVSGDGTVALTGTGSEGVVRVWDLATGTCLATLGEPVDGIGVVALTPDGHVALAGSGDGGLRAWSLDWDIER